MCLSGKRIGGGWGEWMWMDGKPGMDRLIILLVMGIIGSEVGLGGFFRHVGLVRGYFYMVFMGF